MLLLIRSCMISTNINRNIQEILTTLTNYMRDHIQVCFDQNGHFCRKCVIYKTNTSAQVCLQKSYI